MIIRRFAYWLVLVLIVVARPSFAAIEANINVADVPITAQTNQAQQRALPSALRQVLIKMSGNPGVMTLPQVRHASRNISRLVQSYSFYHRTLDDGSKQLYFQVTFDANALDQLLRSANQPVWSKNRPLSMVWLKITKLQQSSYVLASSNTGVIANDLKINAKRRGLPYLLPVMDLQDQGFVNTTTQPFNTNALLQAAQRYNARSVIGGDITQVAANQWQGQWLLLLNGQPFQWQNQGANADAIIANAVDDAANIMANQLAVVDNKNLQANVMLTVSGVANLSQYARVINYLKSLAPVTNAQVADMNGSQLTVQVNVIGGRSALVNALAGSHKLQLASNNAQGNASGNQQNNNSLNNVNNSDVTTDSQVSASQTPASTMTIPAKPTPANASSSLPYHWKSN